RSPYQLKRDRGRGVNPASSAIHEPAGSVTGQVAASGAARDGGTVADASGNADDATGDSVGAATLGMQPPSRDASTTARRIIEIHRAIGSGSLCCADGSVVAANMYQPF